MNVNDYDVKLNSVDICWISTFIKKYFISPILSNIYLSRKLNVHYLGKCTRSKENSNLQK